MSEIAIRLNELARHRTQISGKHGQPPLLGTFSRELDKEFCYFYRELEK